MLDQIALNLAPLARDVAPSEKRVRPERHGQTLPGPSGSLGVIGQVGPELLAAHRIQTAVFAAELFLGKLVAAQSPTAVYQPLPRYPGVYRDLSFVVKKDVAYMAIEQAIRAAAGPYLESVDCIDVFAGKSIDKDRRSMAVSMNQLFRN